MKVKHILVAEDDEFIRIGLVDTLESEGYEVSSAVNGAEALSMFKQGSFSLALLDVMMPEKDGYEVCREIRHLDSRVGIIMLTAKGQEIDKVVGLKMGADDYVTKPFGIQELLARVEAAIRRVGNGSDDAGGGLPDSMEFEGFEVNRKSYEAICEGNAVSLSARELSLLEQFYSKEDEVLTREYLLDAVWGIEYMGTTRTLDQHVLQLRKKLAEIGVEGFLETVHGIGYRGRR